MTHDEFAQAVEELGMSLEDMAREINSITGLKVKGIYLSQMKKGAEDGGRDPTAVVAMYVHMKKNALQNKRSEMSKYELLKILEERLS